MEPIEINEINHPSNETEKPPEEFIRKPNQKRFTKFKQLDDFIQSSLNKFQILDDPVGLSVDKEEDKYLVISFKPTIPDLVIWNKTFNKNLCFVGADTKKENPFPRFQFYLHLKSTNKNNSQGNQTAKEGSKKAKKKDKKKNKAQKEAEKNTKEIEVVENTGKTEIIREEIPQQPYKEGKKKQNKRKDHKKDFGESKKEAKQKGKFENVLDAKDFNEDEIVKDLYEMNIPICGKEEIIPKENEDISQGNQPNYEDNYYKKFVPENIPKEANTVSKTNSEGNPVSIDNFFNNIFSNENKEEAEELPLNKEEKNIQPQNPNINQPMNFNQFNSEKKDPIIYDENVYNQLKAEEDMKYAKTKNNEENLTEDIKEDPNSQKIDNIKPADIINENYLKLEDDVNQRYSNSNTNPYINQSEYVPKNQSKEVFEERNYQLRENNPETMNMRNQEYNPYFEQPGYINKSNQGNPNNIRNPEYGQYIPGQEEQFNLREKEQNANRKRQKDFQNRRQKKKGNQFPGSEVGNQPIQNNQIQSNIPNEMNPKQSKQNKKKNNKPTNQSVFPDPQMQQQYLLQQYQIKTQMIKTMQYIQLYMNFKGWVILNEKSEIIGTYSTLEIFQILNARSADSNFLASINITTLNDQTIILNGAQLLMLLQSFQRQCYNK
ncbi:MAG: hypothetical protein MJ252_25440 [archaeon]|nr:hypothetical protein [archaeon]